MNDDFIIGSNSDDGIIDISSSSKKGYDKNTHVNDYVEKYGNGIFKNLGSIIKFFAVMIFFLIMIMSFGGAFFIYMIDKNFIAISLGIIVAGLFLGLMVMFIIYGVGQIICQNNEILTKVKRIEKRL